MINVRAIKGVDLLMTLLVYNSAFEFPIDNEFMLGSPVGSKRMGYYCVVPSLSHKNLICVHSHIRWGHQ